MRAGFIAITAAVGLLSSAALAADLPNTKGPPTFAPPPPPALSWGGFYIGLNGGYGFGTVSTSNTYTVTDGALFGAPGNFPPGSVFAGPDRKFNISGGFGGGQIGYNYQIGSLVLGPETDFQYGSIRGTDSFVTGGVTYGTSGKIDWFGTVRGRVGYAFDRILPYITGGLAYDHTQTNVAVAFTGAPTFSSSVSDVSLGYTVGAGLEFEFAQNWTAKIEYLYANFGRRGYDFAFAGTDGSTVHADAVTQINLVRAGVNFKFYGF